MLFVSEGRAMSVDFDIEEKCIGVCGIEGGSDMQSMTVVTSSDFSSVADNVCRDLGGCRW